MRSGSPCTAALNLPAAVSLYRFEASGTGGMPGTVVTVGDVAAAALAAGAPAVACACAGGAANHAAAASTPAVTVAVASVQFITLVPRFFVIRFIRSRLARWARGAGPDCSHRRGHDVLD